MHVHKLVEPVWQSAWRHLDKKLNEQARESNLSTRVSAEKSAEEAPEIRLSRCLKLFSTLANVDLALQQRTDEQAAQLINNIALLIKQLPAVLQDYTKLAGELAGALPNQFEMFTKVT